MVRISLFSKVMLILILFILPICAFSIYTISAEQRSLESAIIDSTSSSIEFYMKNLESEISRLQSITYAYALDENLVKLSVMYDDIDNYQRVEATLNARSNLALLKEISPYARNIYAYLPAMGRKLNALNCDYELSQDEVDVLMRMNDHLIIVYGDKLLVRSYYPVGMTTGQLPKLMLAVEISKSEIRRVLSEIESNPDYTAILYGDDFSIQHGARELDAAEIGFINENIAVTDSGSDANARFGAEQTLFVWRYSSLIGAKLVVSLPRAELFSTFETARLYLFIIIVLMFAGLTAIAYSIYRMVHLPMRRMVRAFEEVERGRRDVRLKSAPRDEFKYLFTQFNHMMDTLEGLIGEVYEWKILSQESQLKQLQMQINPHFFYNSFFILRGMIEMGDLDCATRMLENLGQFFRYITRNGRDQAELATEAEHARAYVEIQKMRFESISVRFDAPPEELARVMVPRLILEPVIENAYLHSLEKKDGPGRLEVTFETDGDLIHIHVTDDGSVTDDIIDELARKLSVPDEKQETTGLINIHRRLRIFYRGRGGISVSRSECGGMHVILTIALNGR